MKIISYPIMQTKCKRCDCEFTFNYSDVYFRVLYTDRYTHVICPLCGSHIYLPDNYKDIRAKYEKGEVNE